MPEFSLFGVPVRVDPTFLLFAAYFAYMAGGGVAGMVSVVLAVFLSILVHEAGHAAVASVQKRHSVSIVIMAFGGYTSFQGNGKHTQNLLLSLAGPAASLAFGGLALAIGLLRLPLPGSLPVLLEWLFLLNIFWGLFNLLPVFPMDGGQALGHALSLKWPNKAWSWTHRTGLVGSGLLVLWGLSAGHIFLAAFGVYFAFANWQRLQGPGW